jgi:hypothetical protein
MPTTATANQSHSAQRAPTRGDIARAITRLTGIPLTEDSIAYLSDSRGPVLAAIAAENGEELAALVSGEIQRKLAAGGTQVLLTPARLIAAIKASPSGDQELRDALSGNPDAAACFAASANASDGRSTPTSINPSLPPPVSRQRAAQQPPEAPASPPRGHGRPAAPAERISAGNASSVTRLHPSRPAAPPASAGAAAEAENPEDWGLPPSTEQRAHIDDASQAPGGEPATGRRRFDRHIVYGRTEAISIECSPAGKTTAGRELNYLTINLKGSKATDGKSCLNGINWDGALALRLEPGEIGPVIACLMGLLPKFRSAGHGPDNSKWFEIVKNADERFAHTFRLKLGHKGTQIGVNISPIDFLQVLGVFERAACSALRTERLATTAKLARLANLIQADPAYVRSLQSAPRQQD